MAGGDGSRGGTAVPRVGEPRGRAVAAGARAGPRRCAAAGCGRFVGGGAKWCRRHGGAGGGEGAEFGQGGGLRGWGDGAGEEEGTRNQERERFLAKVRAGEYRALAEAGLAETVARAARSPGLATEIGMVRVALARLLEEEADAGKFAAGVARLVAVAVQAARVERAGAAGAGIGAEEAAVLVAALRSGLGE